MKNIIKTLIILYKSTAGFAQKTDSDGLWRINPKLPTVLEFISNKSFMNFNHERVIPTIKESNVKMNCRCKGGPPSLFILDWKKITEMNGINPQNVEWISVLKNNSAVAKYGEKGRNGVIIITSKKKWNCLGGSVWIWIRGIRGFFGLLRKYFSVQFN